MNAQQPHHDALIDRTAHDMTAGTPGADFRARVIAALPEQQAGSWMPRLIAIGGATAVVALAVAAALRTAAPVVAPAPPVRIADAAPARPAADGLAPEAGAQTMQAARSTLGERVPRAERARVSQLPPLAPIEKPVLAPIQPVAVSIAPISVDAIESSAIAVPPIDRRNGGRLETNRPDGNRSEINR